jgi:hypothetical protein
VAVITPPARIGLYAGGTKPTRPPRKPTRKARKLPASKAAATMQPMGLINR